MSKGTRGKTEVNNDENYMSCIPQHSCQNNPVNWSILVGKIWSSYTDGLIAGICQACSQPKESNM